MKNIILFCAILLFNSEGQCQMNEVISKIYLRDGSVLIGKIVEVDTVAGLRIQLKDGVVFQIPRNSIKKIIQTDNSDKYKIRNEVYEFKEKGFYNVNYTAVYTGASGSGSKLGFGLSATGGYMFNRYFGMGIGLGYDKMDFLSLGNNDFRSLGPNSGINCIYPVFLETRGYFYGKHNAYYYSMNAGYGFVNKEEGINITNASGGLMLHPSVGIRFGGKKHFNFCVDLGMKFQQVDYVENFFDSGSNHYYINYKRFILRVGIQI